MSRVIIPVLSLLAGCAVPSHDLGDSWSTSLLEPLAGPCDQGAVVALALDADGAGWVGCEGSGALFRTQDAGGAYRPMHSSLRLEVNQLGWDHRGRMLLCGRDYASPGPDVLLTRWSEGEGWTPLLRTGDDGPSSCGRVAVDARGGLAVLGGDGGGLGLRAVGGADWLQPPVSWMGLPTIAPRLYAVSGDAPCWHALGADLTSPPVFLRPSSGSRCFPLEPVTVDAELVGELWTMASPDQGQTWLVGGRDLGDEPYSQAVIYRSPDGGLTWRALPLPAELGWLRRLAFSDDGRCGVGVGERSAEEPGGFVIVTEDQGRSWRSLDVDVPPLGVVEVGSEGFVVGGDDGYLGRGWCD